MNRHNNPDSLKLVEKIELIEKVYDAMKRNKLYTRQCPHLKKILKENTAGFSQEEYLKALLGHIPNVVRRPFNLFFRLMQRQNNMTRIRRDIWLDWLSQPTDPVYKSLLSQVICIKDPSSKKSLLEWSSNTDSTKARAIKAWIKKVLPDETFENLSKESEPVTLPAYLPEDYEWSPPHEHQPAKETPELLLQNPEDLRKRQK